MSTTETIDIAGVRFRLAFEQVPRRCAANPAHDLFRNDGTAAPESISVRVRVTRGNRAVPDDAVQLFRAEDAWAMFSDPAGYWFRFGPPAPGAPLWTVRFDRAVTDVTVFCNEAHCGATGPDGPLGPFRYPLDQILLVQALAERRGLLIHGAAAEVDGSGYVFAGRSGAGKSTLSRLLAQREGVRMLSDDRVVVRGTAAGFRVCGTPWPGKAGFAVNRSVPLRGLFFIAHDAENAFEPLAPQPALHALLPVTSLLWYDRAKLPAMLAFCDELVRDVPAYRFRFRPDTQAADAFTEFSRVLGPQ